VNEFNSDFATILNRATQSGDRPNKSELVSALQAAEVSTRTEKLAIPFASLIGEWRLCFATGANRAKGGSVKLGQGYYVPKFIAASITFASTDGSNLGTATNQLTVGTVYIRFSGPCRYPGKKNLLVFDFTEVEVKILGVKVYQGKIRSGKNGGADFSTLSTAKLPFFAFFWAGKDSIAARGRSGGMALWCRNSG
jgi:hypothetical protein